MVPYRLLWIQNRDKQIARPHSYWKINAFVPLVLECLQALFSSHHLWIYYSLSFWILIIFVYGQTSVSLFRCCCSQTASSSSSVCMHIGTHSFQTMFISYYVPNSLKAWELRFHCPPQNWKAHQEIILGASTMPATCHCHLIFQAFCALLLLPVPWGRQLSTHSSYSGRGEQGSRDHSF